MSLRGSLLAAVERVLRELDVEERLRRRRQWERDVADHGPAGQAMKRLRSTGRAVAEQPRRLRSRWR